MEEQASALSQQFRVADWRAWLKDRQAWLEDRQAWLEERQAWLAEKQTLVSRLQRLAAAPPPAMTEPGQSRATEAAVKAEISSPPKSSADLLEDVRQSFMKMAPRAFEVGNVMDEDVSATYPTLSEAEQVELWTKVWDSFDFSDTQRIDVHVDWDEQPVDIQILSLALSNWDEFDEDDEHSIRDLVFSTATEYGDELAKHDNNISRGLRRLERFVRFKRALKPQAPAESATTTDAAFPFPWLDIQLSHFQHLGWRLRPHPDMEDEMIDYNDYADDQDPRARFIVYRKDHFKPWQEGGLLMPLLQDSFSLGKALELVYSTEYHPLCLLGEAWRFAKRLCKEPTDADLRAALLYQIMIVLHKEGPFLLWALLDVDWRPE